MSDEDGVAPRGKPIFTAFHWGAYESRVEAGRLRELRPLAQDPDPSPIASGLPSALRDPVRILRPHVRAGWLEKGPRVRDNARGAEPFVALDWDEALDLVAREIERVRGIHGNRAIFGGSYGWGSAGRFHHAQSQIHRFLKQAGGYTRSVQSYSYAAAQTLLPHVVGTVDGCLQRHTDWSSIAEQGELVVAFGGMPRKNAQVNPGGVGRHKHLEWLQECRRRGIAFVSLSPIDDDLEIECERLRPIPGSDTAILLALAHTLVVEERHDRVFLERYTVGFERFRPYLLGESDGRPKDAEWAADLSGLPAESIRSLARRMAASRTLITAAWSLQRGDHGEQTYWAVIALAALVGQIGLPGGGFGFGYGSVARVGQPARLFRWASVGQGDNPVEDFIPVSRISELLERPGGTLEYDGRTLELPDTRLVYWVGGNPFHHHQDLNRLVRAWQYPETVVVHEPWWNPLARHADIVLPATNTVERNDIGAATLDGMAVAMKQAVEPPGEARNDYDILAAVAHRLGFGERFTEGRDEAAWLRHLYEMSRQQAARFEIELPSFEEFWEKGIFELPAPTEPTILFGAFRRDPEANPLRTPSGRIEIFSETIAGFGYEEAPGHPVWREPREWLRSPEVARFPIHLISNQPSRRLHSQLDNGSWSRAGKVAGREPIRLNPADAAARGIAGGDVVRVFNDRGACLAGAVLSEALMPGVAELPTGAWYDPEEPGRPGSLDKHGNPNVLTADRAGSRLTQALTPHSCLVEVERFQGEPPPVTAFEPPKTVARNSLGAGTV